MPEPAQQGKQCLWGQGPEGGWADPRAKDQGRTACHFHQAYLPQGPPSTQGFSSHVPQDTPGPWLPEHRQGQQGLGCGPKLGIRLQHHVEDRTQLRRQACPWSRATSRVTGP